MVNREARWIEQALAEYETYCAGRLSLGAGSIETEDGVIQYCGVLEDPQHWTVAYVREDDRSVTPLAVGELQTVLRAFQRLDARGAEFGDTTQFPPPCAVIGGVPHRFQAAEGRFLVGVVRVGPVGVLLVTVEGALAVVHVEGKAVTVLHAGPVRGPIMVDVDVTLRLAQPQRRPAQGPVQGPAQARPVRPDPNTQAHHLRITGNTPVDTVGGPPVEVVLRGCFADIVRRVEKLPPCRDGDKRRGLAVLGKLLDSLYKLAMQGKGDLVGVRRTIIAKLRAHVSDFDISEDALSDAFALLLRVKTCIAHRDKLRWTIRLAGLTNPRSELHRQLCKETEDGGWFAEAANRQVAGHQFAGAEATVPGSHSPDAAANVPGSARTAEKTTAVVPTAVPQEWMLQMLSDAASLAVQKAMAGWRADKAAWEAERAELLARLARAETAQGGAAPEADVVARETPPSEPQMSASPHVTPDPESHSD